MGSTRRRRKAHRHGALCHMRDSKGRASTGLGACRGSATEQGCRQKAERPLGSDEASCEKECCRRQAAEHARARSWKSLRLARNKGSEERRKQRWADRGGRGARTWDGAKSKQTRQESRTRMHWGPGPSKRSRRTPPVRTQVLQLRFGRRGTRAAGATSGPAGTARAPPGWRRRA